MSKIYIRPTGETLETDSEKTLLECLRENDIYIKSSCGGVASCSDCIVKISEGEDNLSSPPFEELQLLGNVFHITKERLACQSKVVEGNVTIDISAHDKDKDEKRLRNKTTSFSAKTRVRKKDEVDTIMTERKERVEQKRLEREAKPANEKEGGKKRPMPFISKDED